MSLTNFRESVTWWSWRVTLEMWHARHCCFCKSFYERRLHVARSGVLKEHEDVILKDNNRPRIWNTKDCT